MFAAEFLIGNVAVDQHELNWFSLEQLASSYYVPMEIMKLNYNN